MRSFVKILACRNTLIERIESYPVRSIERIGLVIANIMPITTIAQCGNLVSHIAIMQIVDSAVLQICAVFRNCAVLQIGAVL